jgi:predicted GIY-YIG superfamily endonuclease
MKDHFGMRVIKAWLDSEEAIDAVIKATGMKDVTFDQRMKIRYQLIQSSCLLSLRCWINVCLMYFKYIAESPEFPIGKVVKTWLRAEFQEHEANVFHVHSILWLADDDGTPEGIQKTINRIRGAVSDMIQSEEVEQFISDGTVSSYVELVDILNKLSIILRHRHDRRCMVIAKSSGKRHRSDIVSPSSPDFVQNALQTELKCKVVDNRALSLTPQMHSFLEILGNHTDSAVHVLSVIGLVQIERRPDVIDGFKVTYLHEGLVGRRHIPRTSGEDDIISPVLAKLIILNPCSNNVQYLDSYGVCRYLAKYCTYVDESNRVYIKAQDAAGFKVSFEKIGNTKISAIFAKEKERKKKKKPDGRLISQAEVLMRLLNHSMVYTNLHFIHVPSVPLEERCAFDRIAPVKYLQKGNIVDGSTNNISDLDASQVLPICIVRDGFGSGLSSGRRLRESEKVLALDQVLTPMSLDGITLFGLRPPELRFIRSPAMYHRCFDRKKIVLSSKEKKLGPVDGYVSYLIDKLNVRYGRCAWVDSTLNGIMLRASAIDEVVDYIYKSPDSRFESRPERTIVLGHFVRLQRCFGLERAGLGFRSISVKEEWEVLKQTFLVSMDEELSPVIWFTTIKPVHTERFLIHVLLSMGSYVNELELMATGSLRKAFLLAGLFDEISADLSPSVNRLTKRYILEQLKNQPGGSSQFDRHCVAAFQAFNELIVHDRIASDGLPPVLYTHLRQVTIEEIESSLREFSTVTMACVLSQVSDLKFDNLPTLEELRFARENRSKPTAQPSSNQHIVSNWSPSEVPASEDQPEESHLEQLLAIRIGMESIMQYFNACLSLCPKSVVVVGGPGTGKTTVMLLLMLYAMTLGLNVCVTALLSERAIQLGGKHLHWLFMLPVRESSTPGRIAELAIAALFKTPWKLELLRRLDVIFLDELGQISAETLSVLDIIFRRIRSCTRFMGGVLLISTKDILQLLPINGRPPMTSAHMISSFRFAKLNHSVRAAKDANLRRIQLITRLMPTEFSNNIIHEFETLLIENCTFVADENSDEIPSEAMFVYGRRAPVKLAKNKAVEKLRESHHGNYSSRLSMDEECTTDGNWMTASATTVQQIDRKAKEPTSLYFFKKGLYETTFNHKGKFSQSQLAILFDVPFQADLNEWKPVEVYVSPAGCKEAPPSGVSKAELEGKGWTAQMVGCVPERLYNLGNNQKGRRKQYGLQHRVASTLHAVMGQTLASVVTRVYSEEGNLFSLWERAQVVVLLSRTRFAKDIIFMGDPKKTAKALTEVLLQCSQYLSYMCRLLETLTETSTVNTDSSVTDPVIIEHDIHPFRPIDVALPKNDSGCCYILVSVRHLSVTYIGQTNNLSERLNQHNSGHGSNQTMADNLRPWALLGYVVGFDSNRRQQLAFEAQWKASRVRKQRQLMRRLTANEVADLAIGVIQARKTGYHSEILRFVRAGNI